MLAENHWLAKSYNTGLWHLCLPRLGLRTNIDLVVFSS